MSLSSKVNDKIVIKNTISPKYFHCFKLNDASYALFDIKMDMPLVIGSLVIIKTTKLPQNSSVFYYEIHSKGYFEKGPEKTIDIRGEGLHQKPPLRYHDIDKNNKTYHVFKLSPILYTLWDIDIRTPIVYGSYQRIQATLNEVEKDSTIYYYKEDLSVKNSFKFYAMFKGKKIS